LTNSTVAFQMMWASFLPLAAFSAANEFLGIGNVPKCFDKATIAQYAPPDRSDFPVIRFPTLNWPAARVTYYMTYYLVNELLGYPINKTEDLGGTVGAWNSLNDGTVDLSVDMWGWDIESRTKYVIENPTVLDLGFVGYKGQGGVYLPTSVITSNPDAHYENYISFYSSETVDTFGLDVEKFVTEKHSDVEILHTYIPEVCGQRKCAWMIGSATDWYQNHYQSAISNLNLPIKIIWLGIAGMFKIVNELIKMNENFLFFHEVPDGFISAQELTRWNLPTPTDACYANHVKDLETMEGKSSINCDFIGSDNINEGNLAFWMLDQEKFQDARNAIQRLTITSEHMTQFTKEEHLDPGNEHKIVCNWLKANSNVWSEWAENVWVRPKEVKTLDLEVILLCIFAAVVVMVVVLYILHTNGIIKLLSDAISADAFYEAIISIAWKIIDYAMTIVGLFEVQKLDTEQWYDVLYFVFFGIHTVCVIFTMYCYYQLISFFRSNVFAETKNDLVGSFRQGLQNLKETGEGGDMVLKNSKTGVAITPLEEAQYHNEKFTIKANISLAGCFSFFAEDLIGSFMQVYALYYVPGANTNMMMYVVTVLQILETGLSAASFSTYGPESSIVELTQKRLEYLQNKGDQE